MKIGICDDVSEVREMIADLVRRKYPAEEICLYGAGKDLLMEEILPDILFMDIQMPGIDGMETARILRERKRRMCIVFVTVMEDMVFEVFDVGAFHYLVKPFAPEKFDEVLSRAVDWCTEQNQGEGQVRSAEQNQSEEQIRNAEQNQGEGQIRSTGQIFGHETEESDGKDRFKSRRRERQACVVVKQGGVSTRVLLKDIMYAEVFNRKVVLHTITDVIEYYGRLSELEKQAGDGFFRVHRAYLVNMAYVVRYDAHSVTLETGQTMLSKQKYGAFVKAYLRFCKQEQRRGE